MSKDILNLTMETQFQKEMVEDQKFEIKQQMEQINKQTEQLLNNDYFLFFGETNK